MLINHRFSAVTNQSVVKCTSK